MSPRIPRFPRRRAGAEPTTEQPAAAEQATASSGGLDGVRAWLAELDRRLRARSWLAIGIAVIGLAAGAAGILLALDAKDNAATEEDLNEVRTKITTVEQTAAQAAAEDVAALARQLDGLEAKINVQGEQVDRNKSEIRVADDDIEDLRNELAELTDRVADLEAETDSQPSGGSGGTG